MGRHFAKLACQCHDKNRDRIMFLQSSNTFEKSDWVIKEGLNNRSDSWRARFASANGVVFDVIQAILFATGVGRGPRAARAPYGPQNALAR